MGRALVADHDNAFTPFYNPAAMILSHGMNAAFSYASPYYLITKGSYTFLGATYHAGKSGVIGFHRFHFSVGEEYNPVTNGNSSLKPFTP